jgi:hypothetical protein
MTIEPVDALAARLKELRPSAKIAASKRRATNPREALDMFVESLGFRTIGMCWRQLDKDEANALLKRVLERDMAYYDGAEMESEQAAALAEECLDLAGAADYFTNGSFSKNGWSGHKVAPGTFETGVAWVAAERVGILWVQDED